MMRTPAGPMALAIVPALALLMAFQATPGQGNAQAQRATCPNEAVAPRQASAREHRAAIICLIAKERKQADRRELKSNRALTRIARRHTALMLTDPECFRHRCPGEPALQKRLIDSDYLKAGGTFGFGENLGCAQTPLAQVTKWMDSPSHRRNVLGRKFRHIGVGFGKGVPGEPGDCQDRGFATYTVIFAWRKR